MLNFEKEFKRKKRSEKLKITRGRIEISNESRIEKGRNWFLKSVREICQAFVHVYQGD